MKEEYIDFLKFVDSAMEFAKQIPKYFSIFSITYNLIYIR